MRTRWFMDAGLLAALALTAQASTTRVDELLKSALALDANRAHGATLYQAQCQSCHGARGTGDARNVVPALAGQRERYLVKQLADFTELERESSDMHKMVAAAGLDAPQAMLDLAAYLNGLPALQHPQTGDGTQLDLGEGMFQEQCASCHGHDARGDDDGFVPSLRNQHYDYLLQQMRRLASGHRTNVDPDLVRFLDSLDAEEMSALADYLSRLHSPVKDRRRMRDDGTVAD